MYSHYVPRFILKKFSNKLSLYNIHTGELAEDINVDKAYAQKGFYDDDTEKNLNFPHYSSSEDITIVQDED